MNKYAILKYKIPISIVYLLQSKTLQVWVKLPDFL